MKYFLILLILAGFTGSAFALSDESQITAMDAGSENMMESESHLTINIHQTAKFGNLELTFSGVEDSRCPSDVTCVWEGQAVVTFDIYDGSQHQAITFTTGKVTTAYISPHEIKLIGITPYPATTEDISEKYAATISISKNNKQNLPSPLKQIHSGIALSNVECNDGKYPIYKYNLMKIACVTKTTSEKLIERGWASPSKKTAAYQDNDFTNTVKSNNQFAFDFYSQVNKNDQNVFFSPWSMSSAFAMLNEGARGNTAKEIQQVFGFEEDNYKKFAAINEKLEQKNTGYQLSTANALWLAPDFVPHKKYVDAITTYYGGEVSTVDFTDNATKTINNWVSKKTEEKIPELFKPDLDERTKFVITNAVYFNGTWTVPFDDKLTRDDKFIVKTGKDVTVPFMNRDGYYNYTKNEKMEMIEMPYEGDKASMLILLPTRIEGITSLEDYLTAENMEKWKIQMSETRRMLQIPKFSLETEYNLVSEMMKMGISDAFGPADFAGMSDQPLFVNRAVHKAFVDVNEKGTEAAAATGIGGFQSGPEEFRADHPFVFIIQEKETGQILFIGRVMNPSR